MLTCFFFSFFFFLIFQNLYYGDEKSAGAEDEQECDPFDNVPINRCHMILDFFK